MTFNKIQIRLAYGRKIRRATWPEEVYIEYNGSEVFMKVAGTGEVLKRFAETDRLLSLDDVFAVDWEILKL